LLSMAVAGLLTSFGLSAQRHAPLPAGQFRLAQVRSVFVEPLGGSEAANIVHDQLVAALLNRTNLRVESGPSRADARLTGTATVRSGEARWLVGSSASSAAAAAVASPAVSAAAASAATQSHFESGSRSIRITELGLVLADSEGRILWAYDGSRCLDKTTLLLVGVPRRKSPRACAAEEIARAVDKDGNARRHGH